MNARVTLVEPGTVRLERLLPGPLERVWAYITESDKRAKWLAAGEFDLRVGGKARLEFDNSSLSCEKTAPEKYRDRQSSKGSKFDGVITSSSPCAPSPTPGPGTAASTEVTYELTPRARTCFSPSCTAASARTSTPSVMGGWDVHTGILEDVLKGIEPRPFWTTHDRLEKEYAAALQVETS